METLTWRGIELLNRRMVFKILNRKLTTTLLVAVLSYTPNAFSLPEEKDFRSYWYNYGAEITRFEIEQARYGEIHPGHAVLVFVTEPFIFDKQVKADYEMSTRKNIVPVLKLNFINRFTAGIYDYSMMKSVFTPIPEENHLYTKTLKVSATRQDWCGHVYLQYNLEDEHYKVTQHSYFEKEGDRSVIVPSVYLEDEIWTRIRIDPDTLPLGEIEMIPGSFYTTLLMIKIGSEKAVAELTKKGKDGSGGVSCYTVTYPSLNRTLSIRFNENFPYDILSWSESYLSGARARGKTEVLTTKARRTHALMIDYWNKNRVSDSKLREKLGLAK